MKGHVFVRDVSGNRIIARRRFGHVQYLRRSECCLYHRRVRLAALLLRRLFARRESTVLHHGTPLLLSAENGYSMRGLRKQ